MRICGDCLLFDAENELCDGLPDTPVAFSEPDGGYAFACMDASGCDCFERKTKE